MTDVDPRLVDLYDGDNPDGPDHDFYRAIADEREATSILDLGCGTGLLTVTFARPGRRVVGVDPSPAMLTHAKQRPGASQVEWILGDSRDAPAELFDYTVMAGNVAQHVLDPAWDRTLTDVRARMRRGGTLAFESRNPARQEWRSWAADEPSVRETIHGPLEEWSEVSEVGGGVVEARFHNRFVASDETVTETMRLAFRTRETLEHQLTSAQFDVEQIYGDWHRDPASGAAPLFIVVATAT